MSFWCHRFDQKTNKIFLRISALASKKRLNKKMKALYLFFIISKLFHFLIQPLFLRQSSFSFEINQPLVNYIYTTVVRRNVRGRGEHNLLLLIEIGLTNLPKSGGKFSWCNEKFLVSRLCSLIKSTGPAELEEGTRHLMI